MSPSGSPFDFFFVFLAGLAVSFTPCVYPLIPVSVSYIGAQSSGSKLKGFLLSLAYATGIAVTYSILGLIASLTGSIFGRISSHPVTHLIVGGLIFLFGLSMWDLFTISLPANFKLPVLKKHSYLSTFLFGLGSGFIVSPCLTPALGSILVYLAGKKNLLYGTALLFCFAYGVSFVFILTGTFSAILANLPKSGRWLVYIKRVYAFILTGAGLYLIIAAIRRM